LLWSLVEYQLELLCDLSHFSWDTLTDSILKACLITQVSLKFNKKLHQNLTSTQTHLFPFWYWNTEKFQPHSFQITQYYSHIYSNKSNKIPVKFPRPKLSFKSSSTTPMLNVCLIRLIVTYITMDVNIFFPIISSHLFPLHNK